jgi:hypothetical protein
MDPATLRSLEDLRVVVEITGRTRDRVFVAREILDFVGRDPGVPASSQGGLMTQR